jgi:hypothetical protein
MARIEAAFNPLDNTSCASPPIESQRPQVVDLLPGEDANANLFAQEGLFTLDTFFALQMAT